jgi:hypothetical protein
MRKKGRETEYQRILILPSQGALELEGREAVAKVKIQNGEQPLKRGTARHPSAPAPRFKVRWFEVQGSMFISGSLALRSTPHIIQGSMPSQRDPAPAESAKSRFIGI